MTRAAARPPRPLLAVLGALLVLAGGPVAGAAADGDPASDLLISQDVFFPYAPNAVAKPLQAALTQEVKAAKAAGFPVKVAVIAAAADLGSVPQLLTDPQKYADLLTAELSFNTRPRVLVVLPSGLGGNNLGDRAGPALTGITVDPAGGADGLTQAAMRAVGALTKANGTPVPVPAAASQALPAKGGGGGSGGGGASPLLVFGLPVALVAIVAALAARHDRRRPAEDEDEDGHGAEPGDGEGPDPSGTDAGPSGDGPAGR